MKKQKRNPIKILFSNTIFAIRFLLKTNRSLICSKIAVIILQAVSTFIPIIFIRMILNALTYNEGYIMLFLYIFLYSFSTFIVHYLENLLGNWDQMQLAVTRYKSNLLLGQAVMKMSYSTIETPVTKNFISLAQGDSLVYIFTLSINMISSIIKIIGLTAIVLTFQPIILLVIIFVVFVKLIVANRQRAMAIRLRQQQVGLQRESSYLYEIMRDTKFAKEMRVNNLSDWIGYKIRDHFNTKMVPIFSKALKARNKFGIIGLMAQIIQEAIVYLYLAYRVIFGGMKIGDFSMYLTSIKSFTSNVTALFSNFSNLIQQGQFATEFRTFIEFYQSKKVEEKNSAVKLPSQNIGIEFIDVSFRYPGTETWILKNISLKIEPGEKISIVGCNGAGKTTLVKLLCRFYNPDNGEIRLNGVAIHTIPMSQYISLIGAVFQDYKLFSFSVRENIEFDTKMNKDRLRYAMQMSGLQSKVDTLPNQENTSIGKEFDDYGVEFSAGEGQKLAIARALYKNAPIAILDEPTASLDPIAEYDIYCRFHELSNDKTTIYISHRLSSSRFTDKIVVLDKGTIAEYGTHAELISLNGIYKKMFDTQSQYYK